MTAAAAPSAWQHDKPTVGRLLTKEVADALGWRPDEHYQLAVQPPDQMLRPRILPVAKVRSPGAMIALESPIVVGGVSGYSPDRFYFAPNPVDPNYLDHRVTRKGRPNRFDITRFAAFMMDLDFKPGGVVDQAGAADLIRRFAEVTGGWYPALLVHSGHGWQPTYRIAGGELTEEFGPGEVAVLLARIHTLVATLAAELNLGVDSVFEATRLQRMPGSINGKMINDPVPVTLLPLDRIEGHPGTPVGMDLATLTDLLDSEDSDAHIPVTKRHLARGKAPIYADAAVSPADGWAWAPDDMRCTYLESVLSGWQTDIPPARNPWLFSNAIRLACAHRLGCLTEQAWHDAVAVLVGRFRTLLTMTTQSGGPRDENPDEVSGCFDRALAYAAAKGYPELVAELGGHDPADPFMKASHLLPPEEGVDDVPPPSAPLHLAVDTGAVADQVAASVASIAALAPASAGEAPPSPPSPPRSDVPPNDGKDDPARLWPDPKPAGGMSRLARAIVTRDHTWTAHPDGRPRFTLRYVLGDWWQWKAGRGWARFTTVDKPLEAVVLMLRQRLEFAWFNRRKMVDGKPVVVKERLSLNGQGYQELARTVQAVVASNGPYFGNDLRGWLSVSVERIIDGVHLVGQEHIRADPADNYLVLTNGILNIRTRQWEPPDPDLFDPAGALNLSWPTDGSLPPAPLRWLRFLTEVFPPCADIPPPPGDPIVVVDAETQATLDGIAAASENVVAGPPSETRVVPLGTQADRLQEVFGYLLTNETRAQKVVSFLGQPAGGKGTVLRVLEGLMRDHYVAPTEHDLTAGSFGLWSLMSASVAVITDSRTASVTAAASRRFLQLLLSVAGEDKKLVQRKHLPDWHGRLNCRIVVVSNLEMDLDDHSGALLRRMLAVKFPRSFAAAADPHLTDTLLTELPGILAWALDGRDRLEANDHRFTTTVEGNAVLDAMRAATDEYREFVELYLEIADDKEWVVYGEIVTLYAWWAEHAQNIPKARQLPANHLGGKLREVLAGMREGFVPSEWRPKEHGKNLPRRWRRLRFTDAALAQLESIRTGLP